MRNFLLSLITAVACSSCIQVTQVIQAPPAEAPVPPEEVVELPPRTVHEIRYTTDKIEIDGVREAAWDKAQVVDWYLVPPNPKKPRPATPSSMTKARMMYDDTNLYVLIEAEDKDIFGYFTEHDSQTCTEDVLEVFLAYSPAQSGDPYIPVVNFEINALGTVYDAFTYYNRSVGMRNSLWDCENLKVVSRISGTLNKHEDEDEGWNLEIAIPFASLPWMKGRTAPIDGEAWSGHLARYDYSAFVMEGSELSSSAPLSMRNFHLVEEYQPFIFKK